MLFEWLNIWCCSLLYTVYAGQVKLDVTTSRGHPDFYKDEDLTMSCAASDFTDVRVVLLTNNLFGSASISDGCVLTTLAGWVKSQALVTKAGFTPVGDYRCADLHTANPQGFTIAVKGNMKQALVGGSFQCKALNVGQAEASPTVSSTLVIHEMKVAPTNLTMTINNNQPIIEGREFTFECESSSAVPTSVYEYHVARSDGSETTSNTYTSGEADRAGITVSCKDKSHPNWPRKVDKEKKSAPVRPHYIVKRGEDGGSIDRNPTVNNLLRCNVAGYPSLTFSWTINGTKLSHSSEVLTLRANADNNGRSEDVSCTASVNQTALKPVSISWSVVWSTKAALPSTPPTDSAEPVKGSVDLVAVVVPIAVVVVIAIVVIVVLVIRKRAVKPRIVQAAGHNNHDQENGGGSGMPMKPKQRVNTSKSKASSQNTNPPPPTSPSRQYKDDPIVYATVDHDFKPTAEQQRSVRARQKKPQAPEDEVLYTTIDPLQTRALAEQKNNGGGDVYENIPRNKKSGPRPPSPKTSPPPMQRQDHQ